MLYVVQNNIIMDSYIYLFRINVKIIPIHFNNNLHLKLNHSNYFSLSLSFLNMFIMLMMISLVVFILLFFLLLMFGIIY